MEQCAEVLRTTKYRAAVALMLFAGIRPEEVHGQGKPPMTWGSIDFKGKLISVPNECSKSRRRRSIEGLPAAVWAWLGEPGAPKEPITTALGINITRSAKRTAGITKWPHDALRRSFATYAVALTSDAPKVALWMGHEGNPTMLHRHYRGLATKAQADAFFALRPAVQAS